MKYSLIFVLCPNSDDGYVYPTSEVLLAYKTKGPFPNRLNGVGGKLDDGDAVYRGKSQFENVVEGMRNCVMRELKEETGLVADPQDVIWLTTSILPGHEDPDEIWVFATTVKSKTQVQQLEKEKLSWHELGDVIGHPCNTRFTDVTFAGRGNIPYYLKLAQEFYGNPKPYAVAPKMIVTNGNGVHLRDVHPAGAS